MRQQSSKQRARGEGGGQCGCPRGQCQRVGGRPSLPAVFSLSLASCPVSSPLVSHTFLCCASLPPYTLPTLRSTGTPASPLGRRSTLQLQDPPLAHAVAPLSPSMVATCTCSGPSVGTHCTCIGPPVCTHLQLQGSHGCRQAAMIPASTCRQSSGRAHVTEGSTGKAKHLPAYTPASPPCANGLHPLCYLGSQQLAL